MATTTEMAVTRSWTQVSNGDCTLQSPNSTEQFKIAISDTEPTTDASLLMRLTDPPVNLAYGTPVWCKLANDWLLPDSVIITVIK